MALIPFNHMPFYSGPVRIHLTPNRPDESFVRLDMSTGGTSTYIINKR